MGPALGTEHDRRINNVGRSPDTTELARLSGTFIVQRFDLNLRGPQQASHTSLTTTVAPNLSHDSSRHDERSLVGKTPGQQRNDLPVATFKRDQCSAVERQANTFHAEAGRLVFAGAEIPNT